MTVSSSWVRGPAGLECARALGQRGYRVTLAEAGRDLGGRVLRESRLPGLAAWGRVSAWRLGRLETMRHVEIYRESRLAADDVVEFGAARVVLATGARWMADLPESPDGGEPEVTVEVMTPDDVMDGRTPSGAVLVLDLDPYYMGGVIAEKLARDGHRVSLATSAPVVSPWTSYTGEQHGIMVRLLECGIDVVTAHRLVAIDDRGAELACVYGGPSRKLACDTLIVSARAHRSTISNGRFPNVPMTLRQPVSQKSGASAISMRQARSSMRGVGTPLRP